MLRVEVACGFQSNLHWPAEGMQESDKLIVIGAAVGELEAAAPAARFRHQRYVPFLGDIDCNQIRGCCRVRVVNHKSLLLGEIPFPRMLMTSVVDHLFKRLPARMVAAHRRLSPPSAIPAPDSALRSRIPALPYPPAR